MRGWRITRSARPHRTIRSMACSSWKARVATVAFSAIALCSQELRFEVASVKPSTGSDGPAMRIDPGGRFTAIGITLRNLITLAYGIRDEDLAGAPSWINSVRFDIVAKPPGAMQNALSKESREQQMVRLQALLRDRFQLRVHRKPEEQRVLVLVANSGMKLREPNQGACPDSKEGPGLITSMSMFSMTLSNLVGQRVLDETGRPGNYCVRLRWTTDDGVPRSIGVGGARAEARPDAPSIFSALQQQLGLRLEPKKMAVEILVV